MKGRPLKAPIYVLPHGIEVIGEYAPNDKCPYWRVRIRPHPFFEGTPVRCNGYDVRRSRVLLASKLGRAIARYEHAHHGDEDRSNDSSNNVEALTAAEHNRHHKTGSRHTPDAKARISAGLRLARHEGRRTQPTPPGFAGKKHSAASLQKLSVTRTALIASGAIPKPVPPSTKGRPMPEAAKVRIRAAKLAYWSSKKEAQR